MRPEDQPVEVPAFARRHYSVPEIARLWRFSDDFVRELFQGEPGVLRVGTERWTGRKRKYLSLRIPEEIAEKVHRRLQIVPADTHRGRRG